MEAPVHIPLALAWIVCASVVAFALAVADKRRAARGHRRVRERTLLLSAVLGGSPGLVAAMLLVRHKWRMAAFVAKLGLVLALQGAAVGWILAVRPGHG